MNTTPWSSPLFPVRGHLATRYAEALKHACDCECPLTEFTIDRLGWSPEIAGVLGADYLTREAIRYGIILSPDQDDAPLVRRRFSYELALINEVYDTARATLLGLIEYEAVIVELDPGISFCRNVTDVLAIKTVESCLTTPKDTLNKTAMLFGLAKGLRKESRLLDDSYIDQMLNLVAQIGDPRGHPLPPEIKYNVGSLWGDQPSPIYVLRNPDIDHYSTTIVITIRPDLIAKDVPCTVLELAPELVDSLHATGHLRYMTSLDFFIQRIADLERDTLLSAGVNPSADSSGRRRQIANSTTVKDLLPPVYWELDAEIKRMQGGMRCDPERLSVEGRWAIAVAAQEPEVMVHLLARFVRYDYQLFVTHHQRIVEAEWSRYSPQKRQYLEALFPYLTQTFVSQAALAPPEAQQTEAE